MCQMAVKIPPTNFTMNLTCLTNTKNIYYYMTLRKDLFFLLFVCPLLYISSLAAVLALKINYQRKYVGGGKKHLNTAKTLLCVSDHV